MVTIKEAGWSKFKQEKGSKMKEADIMAAFKMVDIDKSGEISKMVITKNVSINDNKFSS